MVITHFGKQFFKIQQGETVIAINPISKDSKEFKKAKFGSDIVLVTTNHVDFDGVENATHGTNVPFVINGPGEYEVKEISFQAFASKAEIDKKEMVNTIYLFTIDGVQVAFLGSLDSKDSVPKEFSEAVDEIDLLLVPISGKNTIDSATAHKLATSFKSKMVIPMDYDAGALKSFLKESSSEDVKPIEKLTLKKKDFIGKSGEVVIFK